MKINKDQIIPSRLKKLNVERVQKMEHIKEGLQDSSEKLL